MNKNAKRALIATAILLLICGAVFGVKYLAQRNSVAVSKPAVIDPLSQDQTLEAIPDEEVPLAGEGDVQVVPLVSEEEPVTPAPAATAPALSTATPTPTPIPTTAVPKATPAEAPASTASPAPTPTPTPTPTPNTAARLIDSANALLNQFYACSTAEEKRALLGITNNNFSNDSFRAKLLSDLGGTWELLEDEVVDATQYQQGKTLYVQVFMSDVSSDFVPVVYSTQNADLSGNQWSTNLVYNDESGTWMEYTQKHPYNDSRVGYSMTSLYNNEDGWEELKDVMETSPIWEEVVVPTTPDPIEP